MRDVVLLYGGMSPEHDVSCISALEVFTQLQACGYRTALIGITRDGAWYLQDKPSLNGRELAVEAYPETRVFLTPSGALFTKAGKIPADVIFPVTHGTNGEDGSLQGLLRHLGIPYVGSSHYAAALAMKKSLTKQIAAEYGLPVIPWKVISREDALSRGQQVIIDVSRQIGFPCIIKPESGGSSIGVSRVGESGELPAALEEALHYDDLLLAEPYIVCDEIECTVIGSGDRIITTGTGTIHSADRIYSYQRKYYEGGVRCSVPSEGIDEEMTSRIREISETIYRLLGCSGFARVDFFYQREEKHLYLNEVNTIPGMTPTSLCMLIAQSAGIDWPQFFHLVFADADYQAHTRIREGRP